MGSYRGAEGSHVNNAIFLSVAYLQEGWHYEDAFSAASRCGLTWMRREGECARFKCNHVWWSPVSGVQGVTLIQDVRVVVLGCLF